MTMPLMILAGRRGEAHGDPHLAKVAPERIHVFDDRSEAGLTTSLETAVQSGHGVLYYLNAGRGLDRLDLLACSHLGTMTNVQMGVIVGRLEQLPEGERERALADIAIRLKLPRSAVIALRPGFVADALVLSAMGHELEDCPRPERIVVPPATPFADPVAAAPRCGRSCGPLLGLAALLLVVRAAIEEDGPGGRWLRSLLGWAATACGLAALACAVVRHPRCHGPSGPAAGALDPRA